MAYDLLKTVYNIENCVNFNTFANLKAASLYEKNITPNFIYVDFFHGFQPE